MDTLFLGIIFDLFSGLCTVVSVLFSLFLKIANTSTSIINIKSIMNNIYMIISVVMIFYITINFMTYLVSPDKINDKSIGGSKLIIKIVVTLALLVFTPTIFSISRDLQSAILHENIIGKIILSSDTNFDDQYFTDAGHEINEYMVRAFIVPKEDFIEEYEGIPFFNGHPDSRDHLRELAQDTRKTNFNFVMALVSSVLVCLMLFSFLFDISIRLAKLIFMELIAPLPILTYPFSKGNNNTFMKWVKETVTTYLSVFLRLTLIYFVLFCLKEENIQWTDDNVVNVFIIIGALLLAKQLPTLIQDILGIKSAGNFTLNPMKRIREVPFIGSAVQTVGAAAGGLVTGTALGFKAGGIGNALKLGGLGLLNGGRAGFQQTKLLGVAAKDQKVDKTAYKAGASSVAQAITGSSDASAGFPDRLFNRIGTQLNKPAYEMQKNIDDADKEHEKAAQLLATYQDSQREIHSNMRASVAKKNALGVQLNTIDQDILSIESTRDQRITDGTAQLNNAIQSLESGRATRLANETAQITSAIQALESNIASQISSNVVQIDAQIAAADAGLLRAYQTGDATAQQNFRQQKANLEQQKLQVEQDINNRYASQILSLESQKTVIEQNINNEIDQQITSLENQRNTIDQTVDRQIAQETSVLRNERATIQRSYAEADAVAIDYTNQYNEISRQVTEQETVVADAKAAKKKAKDELKSLLGDYKKNK